MIIAFSGKVGSGKDTAAVLVNEILKEEAEKEGFLNSLFPRVFTKQSFAKKLKECCILITGHQDFDTHEGKNTYLPAFEMTAGVFMQKLGTEGGRSVYYNIWVNALMLEYRALNPELRTSDLITLDYSNCTWPDWVITDCRFINEADAVKSRKGIVIRLEGDPGGKRAISTRDPNHISETALDDYPHFDYIIDNSNDDILGLKAKLYEILKEKKII